MRMSSKSNDELNDSVTEKVQAISSHSEVSPPEQVVLELPKEINKVKQTGDKQLFAPRKQVVGNQKSLEEKTRNKLIGSFKNENKDLYLKLLGKLLYNKKKYFCALECKLFDDTYTKSKYKKEEISDIDVFAIRFEEDLRLTKVGFECKSTQQNGVDEALKIKGIQHLMGLDYAGLIKKRVSNNVRIVAEKINIQIFDEAELTHLVKQLIPEYEEHLKSERELYILCCTIENEVKPIYKGLQGFINSHFWSNKPYQNINTIIRATERIKEEISFDYYQKKYMLIKLSMLFSLSILEVCSIIVRTRYSEVREVSLDQLFGGASSRREKERTFDAISQELGRKLHAYPHYTTDYLNLISWFIPETESASKVSLCLEEYLKCYLLGHPIERISGSFNKITIKLAKDILRFISKIAYDQELFKEFIEL